MQLTHGKGKIMKRAAIIIIAILVLAALGATAYAHMNPTYTLKGQLIDEDNQQAINGGTVTVAGKSTTTDSNGDFTLKLGTSDSAEVATSANNYDPGSFNLTSAKKVSDGLFASTLNETFKATPTVQTEAARKWNYIKYGQYNQVWTLVNPDEDASVPESKYTAALSSAMSAITNAGAQIGDQTVASVVTLPTWTEPNTGKVYKNVKELQTTQNYTILGQTVSKNFVGHWALANGVWTFFVNPKDPTYQAD